MIFNSKQLEELENIHDSTGAFEEEGDDEGGFDEVGEAAMDWRRTLIEEAAENIKRAKTRPVEPHLQYPIASMLFDREARRFGRVQRSVPGFLKIVYLSGGDREYGNLDVVGYLREHGAQRRLSELAEQLGMSDVDVANELERLGITPIEEPDEGDASTAHAEAPVPPIPSSGKAKRPAPVAEDDEDAVEEEEEEDEELDDEDESEEEEEEEEDEELDDEDEGEEDEDEGSTASRRPSRAAPPAKGKSAPPAKATSSAKPAAKGASSGRTERRPAAPPPAKGKAAASAKAAPAAGKKAGGKGAVNPIDDPNGFIKANYQTMSNRELARLTGLSEHTIRRKLGEWSMKRKREL